MASMNQQERVDDERLIRVVTEILAPLIEADRGRVEFVRRHEDVVELWLSGACRGCPGQSHTLKFVALPALQAVDPSVRDVRALLKKP